MVVGLLKEWVWGVPLLTLVFGVGAYLTVLLRGMQFRYLGYALKQIFAEGKSTAKGDISQFEALMTSLAGAIGTGTVVGVATGVAIGGFGSLFWMWITAFLGMAIKYAESLLAVKYRTVDARGEMAGGPMQYMERGLGWRKTALLFAFLGAIAAIGTGNLVQVNSIASAVQHVWDVSPWVTGPIMAIILGAVLFGGVKWIGQAASLLVPVMGILYLGAGCYILLVHASLIPEAFALIIKSAFQGQAAVGGFAGSTIMMAVQLGVARSIFSNEAGLGISSICAAAAKTDMPGRQAMISMTGALLSTVVVCTITGLVLAVTGVLHTTEGLNGAALVITAFSSTIWGAPYIVSISLILFAFTTVFAWGYYGERCAEYLLGLKGVLAYRALYTLLVIPGAAIQMGIVWNLADIFNAFMMVPNLLALVALSGVIRKETDDFLLVIEKEEKHVVLPS